MRKKNELRDSIKSGTPAHVVEKAQKALDQYQFMAWIDVHVQQRERPSKVNMKRKILENEYEDRKYEVEKPTREFGDKNEDDDDDNFEQEPTMCENMRTNMRKRVHDTARDSSLEDFDSPLMNTQMNERFKRRAEEGTSSRHLDGEDIFCQALALDLKQLPFYERCMAKNELRNVIFKYQMTMMEKHQYDGPTRS